MDKKIQRMKVSTEIKLRSKLCNFILCFCGDIFVYFLIVIFQFSILFFKFSQPFHPFSLIVYKRCKYFSTKYIFMIYFVKKII